MPAAIPANAGTIHPSPAPYPGRNVVACVRKGITNLLCSRAYTTLTAPVNRMDAGYMAGHLFVSGPKNASTISTMAIGYMAFKTGTDTASILLRPALDIIRLIRANKNTQAL